MYKKIYRHLLDAAEQENNELRSLCKKGIFHMPELAYVYAVGKKLVSNAENIFGQPISAWQQEWTFAGSGPSDLMIRLSDKKALVFEFKMRDTVDAYAADIAKLKLINAVDGASYSCIFVALVDAFRSKAPSDLRIETLEQQHDCLQRLCGGAFDSFCTEQDRYKQDISCVVAAWLVREE